MMKIEFPCPANQNELTPSANGVYCSHCSKEVVNIDGMSTEEVKELADGRDGICVSSSDRGVLSLAPSLRKFALSAIIVFGTSLFSFADAQMAEKVSSIDAGNMFGASVGLMQIVFVDQEDDTLSSSVDVFVELPNGKEIQPVLHDDNTYWVELPLYAQGKSVIIHADRFGKKKSRSVYVSGLGEPIVEEIKFKIKRVTPRFRTLGCPSF